MWLADSFFLWLQKTLLWQSSNEVMAVVTEIPWEQVVRFAHLLQSCYRSYASTPKRDTSSKSLRHLSDPSPCYRNGHFAFLFYSSVFCNSSLSDTELGFGMMTVLSPILWCLSSFGLTPLLVSWPFGLSFVVHQRSCSSIFCWYSCKVGFPASFLQAYSHSSAPVCCIRIASLLTTFVPLFAPSFSELSYLKATYFYHAKVAWCCEGLPPSCVAAVAVTNKIVRNLPFSSSLSFIANKKKSIANDFHGASHMVPHPCFWMHVKIKFHF